MSLNLNAGNEPVPGYALVRRLGRGGFGEVWEALAPGGVRVALKFIRLGTGEASLELRALEAIRNIRHPHLLDLQFAVPVDDCLVLAMPLCEQTLWDRWRTCHDQGLPGLPREELLGYMHELAQAVDFLNEPRHAIGADGIQVGVQHRDIKPHNVFLVGGSVRLADFGLAKVLEASLANHSGCMAPNYVAPEVIEGHVTRWSDQYGVAVTYTQLRTGKLPFVGDSVHKILSGHLHEPPDLSGLSGNERSVVARALAKRPKERWPTCRAFVLGLEAAIRAEDARLASRDVAAPSLAIMPRESDNPTQISLERAEAPSHRRSRRVAWGGLAAVLTVLIAGAWVAGIIPAGPGRSVPPQRTAQATVGMDKMEARTAAIAGPPASKPAQAARPLKTEKDVLAAIRDDLRQARGSDRPFLRYFTLHNLHNNQDVGDDDLRLARAAVAKLANCLSWKAEIVVPRTIDRSDFVLALDVRDLGWDERDMWKEILGRYPYGLKHDTGPDAPVQALAEEVYGLAGTSMPYVRADWFVATASRPPLYHSLLNTGDDKNKSIRDFPEPIDTVARNYLKDLGPTEVAAELGLGDPQELAGLLQANSRLRALGLAPLARGAAIKRTEWDSLEGRFTAPFQEVAQELKLGTPFRSF